MQTTQSSFILIQKEALSRYPAEVSDVLPGCCKPPAPHPQPHQLCYRNRWQYLDRGCPLSSEVPKPSFHSQSLHEYAQGGRRPASAPTWVPIGPSYVGEMRRVTLGVIQVPYLGCDVTTCIQMQAPPLHTTLASLGRSLVRLCLRTCLGSEQHDQPKSHLDFSETHWMSR